MPILFIVLLHYYNVINSGQTDPDTIKGFITTEAVIQGVNPQVAIGVAQAESNLTSDRIGDHGTSYGLYQIHLPAHPDITEAQAENIIFSTEWSLAEMKKDGGCQIWSTCTEVMKSLTDSS